MNSNDYKLELGYDYLVILKTMSEKEKSDIMLDRKINNNFTNRESNM